MYGYPWFFIATNNTKVNNGTGGTVVDFYESLSSITLINASLIQTLAELIKVHTAENGLAVSCLERALI